MQPILAEIDTIAAQRDQGAALLVEPTDGAPDLPTQMARGVDETVATGIANSVLYAAVGPRRSGVGALVPKVTAR